MAKDTTRLESSDNRDAAQKSLGFIGLSALAHIGVLITVLLAPSLKTVSGVPTGAQAGEEISYAGPAIADPAAPSQEAGSSSPTEVLLADTNDQAAVALPSEPSVAAKKVAAPAPKVETAPALETTNESDVAVAKNEELPAELEPPQMDEPAETQSVEQPVAQPVAAAPAEKTVEAEARETETPNAEIATQEEPRTERTEVASAAVNEAAPVANEPATAPTTSGSTSGEGNGHAQLTAPAASGAGTLGASGGGGAKGVYGVPQGAEIRDARELSALPGNPKPTYPLQDKIAGKQGTTVLVGLVKSDGTVTNVVVEQSSGSKSMDQSAAQAFAKWRYQPGQSGYIRSPFQFQLAGAAKEIPARLRTQ